jgi:hypothetical protein
MVKIGKKSIFPLFAALFFIITACGPDPFFIPVKSISGVPDTGTVGIPLTLTGTVNPVFASNNVITWQLNNDETTGAVMEGNVLSSQTNGIVSVKARVVNGIAEGRDYTKDFIIVFDFDLVEKEPIFNIELKITGPAKNETPSSIATGSGNFTIGVVSWSPSDRIFMGNTIYTATVTVTANKGYIFPNDVTAKINNKSANIVGNTGKTVTLSYKFAATLNKAIKEISVSAQPEQLTYIHGDDLDLSALSVKLTYDDNITEVVALTDFEEKNIFVDPADGDTLSRSTHNNKSVKISIGKHDAYTDKLQINKANGSAVSTPIVTVNTDNLSLRITSPLGPLSNGQLIEYAIGTEEDNPTNGWREQTTFGDLSINTTYFIFARSKENDDYNAGNPSVSGAVTLLTINITLSVENITDETAGESWPAITISRGHEETMITQTVEVTGEYDSIKWEVAGVGAYLNKTVTGSNRSFILDGNEVMYNSLGGHVLKLTVKKDGKTYQVNIPFNMVD